VVFGVGGGDDRRRRMVVLYRMAEIVGANWDWWGSSSSAEGTMI